MPRSLFAYRALTVIIFLILAGYFYFYYLSNSSREIRSLPIGTLLLPLLLLLVLNIPLTRLRKKAEAEKQQKLQSMVEAGVSLHCNLCGYPQRPERLRRCIQCGAAHCAFPPWPKTTREKFDKVFGNVAVIAGIGC